MDVPQDSGLGRGVNEEKVESECEPLVMGWEGKGGLESPVKRVSGSMDRIHCTNYYRCVPYAHRDTPAKMFVEALSVIG